jgi:hypothetical protein
VICSCATPNFVVWFRDRSEKSTINHLLWHVWKIFVIFDAFEKVQPHIPSVSFCSLVRFIGTRFAQIFLMINFSVKMSWTVWWFKISLLQIILTVKRRSDHTTALTLLTFSSVFDAQFLSERGSSFTHTRPCKNALCHVKTSLLKAVLIFRKFLLRFRYVRHTILSRDAVRDFVSTIS